ncbi:protein SCAF11 isoform X2 [Xenopus laevis]|uniref:Protein SCAF11 isoform X2 n=1 Tax=Xenopus laevis TaxID=8355 RepID=A0A8J0UR19_XENLA|nr:protein SCAF11 isoform X2 [Xenopus laevis]
MKNNRFMLAGSDKQHKDDDDDDAREDSTWSSLVACFTKEQCPICLNFMRKDVAFPENCYHAFCFTCILKWSETSTSCPVDRKPFQAVMKIDKVVGCTKIPVKMRITTKSIERYCCDRKPCCSIGNANGKIYFRTDAAKEIPLHNCKDSTCEKKRCISKEKTDLKLKIKRLSWSSACCSVGNPDIYSPANPSGTPNHVSSGSYVPQDSEINLIQMKRDELRFFRTPAVARQTQCNTPLCTEMETLILPLPSFTFFDHIFPLNHFSSRNQDFSKRTCAHSGTQEGTEKKRVAGASSTRGKRKKPVQSSTRRRSTRNSKTEDASQLQSSPKSSNSDHGATGCNSSSTNAESSENVVKSPPKQRKRPKKRSLVRKRLRSNTHTQGESDESKENSGSESEQSNQKSKISRESSSEMGHTDTDTSADHVAETCEHHMDEQSSDIPVSDTGKQFEEQSYVLSPQIESSDKIQYSPDFQNEDSFDKDIASPGLNNGQHLGAEPDSPPSTEQIVLSQSATSEKQLDAARDTVFCSEWLHLEETNYPSTAETEKSQNSQSIHFSSEQSDGQDLEHKLHAASSSAFDTFLESENAKVLPVMSPEKLHAPEENDSTVYVEDKLQCDKQDSDRTQLSVSESHSIEINPGDFPIPHNGHNSPPSLESTVVSQTDQESLYCPASEKQEQSQVGSFADIMSKETHLEATCESPVSEIQSCSESLLLDKLTTEPGDDTASGFSEHKECFREETSTANLPQEHKDKPYFESINITELPEQANSAFAQMHVKGDDCEKQENADIENGNTTHVNFGSTINTGTDLEAHKLHLRVNDSGDNSNLNLEEGNICRDDKSACDFVSSDQKQCEIDSMHKVMDKEILKSESDSQVSEKEDKSNVQKTESIEVNEKLKKESRTRKSRFHSPSTTWSPNKTDIKDRPRSRSRSKVRDSPAKRRSRTRSRDRERGGQWKGRSRDRRHRRQSRSRSKSRSRSRSGSRPQNRSRFSAPDRNSDNHSPHWKDRRSHENWRGSRGHERYKRSDNEKPNEHLRRNEQYKSNEYSRRNEQAKYNEHVHQSETEKRWNEAEKHSDHFRRNESEKTTSNLQLNELEQNNDNFPKNEANVPTDHSPLKDSEKATKHLMHNEPQNMNSEHILQNKPENLWQDESDRPSIPLQQNESEKPNGCFQQEPKYHSNSWQTEPEQHSESVQCNESEKANVFHHSEPEKSGNHFQRSEPERRNEHEKSSDHFQWNEPEKNRSYSWRNELEKPDNSCWPNEPDVPNEQFRNEKHNTNRERSEQYPGNKNHYPDWMAENNKSTEKRGRGANRSRGYTRGSSWSDNQYHSGDSWNRNMNSEWRAPRGRGGRGRGGFRGGLNFGDQNENRWNSRQPFSGNSQDFGPEPSGFTDNRNFRPKYEQEPPNAPADRSGWSSASSWAVRKTLPADVQSYYSKRGKNNAGTQPGWSRQEVSQDQDQTIKDPASQQAEPSQVPVNIVQPQVNVVQQQMNPPPQQPMNIFPYPVAVHPPIVNIQHNPFNIPPQLPMHLHPGLPIVQVTAPTTVPQGLPPPPPPPPPTQQINYIASQQDGKHLQRFQIQERAAQEVKIAIKPYFQNKDITKEEYKEIVKKAVDKVCHSKSGEVDSSKVANLIKAYVDKYKHSRKKGD